MKPKKGSYTEGYSILKATEGGMGQKTALMRLKEEGIEATGGTSCYVGHTAVYVTGTKRTQNKASKILFGR
jgi:hypothetical protein